MIIFCDGIITLALLVFNLEDKTKVKIKQSVKYAIIKEVMISGYDGILSITIPLGQSHIKFINNNSIFAYFIFTMSRYSEYLHGIPTLSSLYSK